MALRGCLPKKSVRPFPPLASLLSCRRPAHTQHQGVQVLPTPPPSTFSGLQEGNSVVVQSLGLAGSYCRKYHSPLEGCVCVITVHDWCLCLSGPLLCCCSVRPSTAYQLDPPTLLAPRLTASRLPESRWWKTALLLLGSASPTAVFCKQKESCKLELWTALRHHSQIVHGLRSS